MMKILSVSIAAYNAEGWLERCISSMVNTTVRDLLDIIIVNDGSKDGTLKKANLLKNKYPDIITVIDKKNGGHGSTINEAIKVAKGKYFKVVDSDDWVEKKGLEDLVKKLMATNVDLVLNPYYIVNAETMAKELKNDFNDKFPINAQYNINELSNPIPLIMHTICFRTEVLQSDWVNLDENCFYVDVEYCIYNFYKCNSVMFLDFPVYDYLLGTAEQSMSFPNMMKRRKQQERVCFSCIAFYTSHSNLKSQKNIAIENRILDLISSQYLVLLCLPYSESKRELKEFDTSVKEKSQYLFNEIVTNPFYMKLNLIKSIKKVRKRKYKYYFGINKIFRFKYVK